MPCSLKGPQTSIFFALYTVLKNLLLLWVSTTSHLFENEPVRLQTSKIKFTPHSKG